MKAKLSLPLAAALLAAGSLSTWAETKVDFAKDVFPIFEKSCVSCHGQEKQKSKLRLDNKADAMKGGKGGVAIVPGDAAKSELYRRVTLPKGHDDIMPSEGDPLSKAQTDLIRDWINDGASWPDGTVAKPAATTAAAKPKNEPKLPADFKPGEAEPKAIAALGKAGVDARPIAMNVPWREANFRLQGSNITDATLAPLADLTSLVDLNLANTKVTDAGLAHLKNLSHLQRLHLENTAVTDAGLAHVKNLPNLVYLNLYGTTVTDAGLEHLTGLKYLRNLYVWQTKVTDAGIATLKKANPDLQVSKGWDLAELAKKEEKKDEKPGEKKEDKK